MTLQSSSRGPRTSSREGSETARSVGFAPPSPGEDFAGLPFRFVAERAGRISTSDCLAVGGWTDGVRRAIGSGGGARAAESCSCSFMSWEREWVLGSPRASASVRTAGRREAPGPRWGGKVAPGIGTSTRDPRICWRGKRSAIDRSRSTWVERSEEQWDPADPQCLLGSSGHAGRASRSTRSA